MKSGKIPLRKCIACGERKTKSELIRMVKASKDKGIVNIFICDGHADGRGAYLCKNSDCLAKARKAKRLERAFSGKVDLSIYDALEKLVNESEQ